MSSFDEAREVLSKVEELLDQLEVTDEEAGPPPSTTDLALIWHDVVWGLCSAFSPEKEMSSVTFECFREQMPLGVHFRSYPLKVAWDIFGQVVGHRCIEGTGQKPAKMTEVIEAWFEIGLGRDFYNEFLSGSQPFTALRVEADPSENLFPSMIQVNPDIEMNWGNILGEVANAVVGMMDHTGRLLQSREHARELLLLEFAKTLADGNEEDELNMKLETKKRLLRMAQQMVEMADEVQRAVEVNDLDSAERSADALMSEASRFMQSLPEDDEESF